MRICSCGCLGLRDCWIDGSPTPLPRATQTPNMKISSSTTHVGSRPSGHDGAMTSATRGVLLAAAAAIGVILALLAITHAVSGSTETGPAPPAEVRIGESAPATPGPPTPAPPSAAPVPPPAPPAPPPPEPTPTQAPAPPAPAPSEPASEPTRTRPGPITRTVAPPPRVEVVPPPALGGNNNDDDSGGGDDD